MAEAMEKGEDLKSVIIYWTQGEITSFFKVWLSAYAALSFVYLAAVTRRSTISRLLVVLPVVFLFLFLPLRLHSMHLGGTSAFLLAWLANFKLLLFAFRRGPLSDVLSLPLFLVVSCLPVKIRSKSPTDQNSNKSRNSIEYAIKGFILAFFLKVYEFRDQIHPTIIYAIYCVHIYLLLEMILAIAAALARAAVGLDLEPQFDDPYLSSSLQDFWGRRWNLMVVRILRPSVYEPVRAASMRVLGRRWASQTAAFATFAVSGLMHELMLYYLGRARPTWEATCYFLLHGACLAAEIGIKKAVAGRWRLHRAVSTPLTVGFVAVTAFWLFLPPMLRPKCDEMALAEHAAVNAFVKDVARTLLKTTSSSRHAID